MKNKAPRGTARSAPNLFLIPSQRYEVGKRAAEYGITASLRYFAKKYPELIPLKETSVRRLKNQYQSNCKQQKASNQTNSVVQVEEVRELPHKKKVDHFFYLMGWTSKSKSTLKSCVNVLYQFSDCDCYGTRNYHEQGCQFVIMQWWGN